jgi:ribosomal protein S19
MYYSTYSFMFQLAARKYSLSKLSEPQRIRLFFVIKEHFLKNNGNARIIANSSLRKAQFSLLRVKVFRSSVRLTSDCIGLPIRVYSGNCWCLILVKKGMVGFPLNFFILLT